MRSKSEREQLLADIERFLAVTGISRTRFGWEAAGNRNLLQRLQSGSNIKLSTVDRIRSYMRQPRRRSPKRRSRATESCAA